jgi:site-specific recombinase XerD
MMPLAPHITAFLRRRLPVERRASSHTCDTYAYAFQLLFEFASQRLNIAPSELTIEHIDAPLVLAFLESLQDIRGNCPRTRNARLAAIKSFMRFVEYRVPSALEQVHRVLAIPTQKHDSSMVQYLNKQEIEAILDAPDPTTRQGVRDRAMLHLGFAGGLRVSELIGLCMQDVTFDSRYVDVHVCGKGRRERVLKLWKEVAASLRAWTSVRGDVPVPEMFLNARRRPMSRSGVEYILAKHVAVASRHCPSLNGKRISPHVMRHTCAMNVLQATHDIRKVALWLGHTSQQTTEIYLHADPVEKLETLDAMVPPMLRPGSFRPPDKLIAMLKRHDYAQLQPTQNQEPTSGILPSDPLQAHE